MNTFQRQSIHSSYPNVSLGYSTSTQNNHLSPGKSFINQQLKERSLISPSIESSAFTFNNLEFGNQSLHSNLQKSTGPYFNIDSSLKQIPFTQSSQLSPRFSTINPQPQQNKLPQNNYSSTTQVFTPSNQILTNQQNYAFGHNRSSLKNFQQKSLPFNNLNSIAEYKKSPEVYKYHQNLSTQNLHHQNQNLPLKTQFSNPFQNKQLKNQAHKQDYRPIQQFYPSSYDFNKYNPNTSTKFYDNNPNISQINMKPPLYQNSTLNPSVQYLQNFHSPNSTLQSKLLNRELTQLKSDQSLKSAVINDDGVQRFSVKFDKNLRKEQDFSGFCGCAKQRIIFDAAEKTPFC